MLGMWMMMTVVLQATAKKREEHRHIKLIERARWRVVLCRGRARGAGRADGGRGGGQERNLHPGKNRLLIGFAYRHREGLVCSGETRQGGQGEALPREALPGCQLVHLGRDPRHSSQPGLPEGAGRHQPAGHPEPPGGQEAGQAGQGDQQWGLLIPLWRLFSKTGAGATRSQDTIQSIHKWHFQPMVLIGAWNVFQISKAILFFYRIGEIPTWHICSIRLPWIGPVGHPLQVQKKRLLYLPILCHLCFWFGLIFCPIVAWPPGKKYAAMNMVSLDHLGSGNFLTNSPGAFIAIMIFQHQT